MIGFLLLGFFIFLFIVYLFAKDDYVLFRKNVSLDQVFNISVICFVVGVLISRLAYVIFHPKWGYLNPLVLFLFPYFPGLLLSGGVIGTMFFLLFITKYTKLPTGRILDIFSLALFPSTIVTMASMIVVALLMKQQVFIIDSIVILVLTIIYIPYAIGFEKTKWKEGVIATSLLFIYALIFVIKDAILLKFHILSILQQDVLFLLLIVFTLFLLIQERLVKEK